MNYNTYARAQSLAQIISQTPKFLLEVLFVVVFAFLLSTSINELKLTGELALAAAGAYKLIPTISLIIQNASRLLYGREALVRVIKRNSEPNSMKSEDVFEKVSDEKNKRVLTKFFPNPNRAFKLNGEKNLR